MGSSGLSEDIDISITGKQEHVDFDVIYGNIDDGDQIILHIDWDQIKHEGAFSLKGNKVAKKLFSAVRDAVAIWYNVTGSLNCFDAVPAINEVESIFSQNLRANEFSKTSTSRNLAKTIPITSRQDVCLQKLQDETVWSPIVCNENMNLIMTYAQGVGRDFYWPPSHDKNQHNYKDTCANRTAVEELYLETCADPKGIFGYPDKSSADPFSRFLDDYYGGLRIGDHSNIIFANGLLDPWSAAGVYPKDRRIQKGKICTLDDVRFDCSMLQNITEDGSVVALTIELGGHHLDLMYSDDEDPDCVVDARQVQEAYIQKWIGQRKNSRI